jgi:hypothetical protein
VRSVSGAQCAAAWRRHCAPVGCEKLQLLTERPLARLNLPEPPFQHHGGSQRSAERRLVRHFLCLPATLAALSTSPTSPGQASLSCLPKRSERLYRIPPFLTRFFFFSKRWVSGGVLQHRQRACWLTWRHGVINAWCRKTRYRKLIKRVGNEEKRKEVK